MVVTRGITPDDSVTLVLMRGRIGFALSLAGSLALALLVVSACHSGVAAEAAAGMSAPLAPASFIEPARLVQLAQLHFDWHGLVPRTHYSSLVVAAVSAKGDTRKDAGASPLDH